MVNRLIYEVRRDSVVEVDTILTQNGKNRLVAAAKNAPAINHQLATLDGAQCDIRRGDQSL